MKYQIIKVIHEVNDFEEACTLAGLSRHPAFDELPGELFWSVEKRIGVFAVPEPGDDETAAAVTEETLSAIPVYHSATEYFAANPEPIFDEADALTGEEAAEIAEASAANMFLKEMGS